MSLPGGIILAGHGFLEDPDTQRAIGVPITETGYGVLFGFTLSGDRVMAIIPDADHLRRRIAARVLQPFETTLDPEAQMRDGWPADWGLTPHRPPPVMSPRAWTQFREALAHAFATQGIHESKEMELAERRMAQALGVTRDMRRRWQADPR